MSYPAKPYRTITSIALLLFALPSFRPKLSPIARSAVRGGGIHRGGVYHGGVAWRGGVYRRGGVAWRGGAYRGAWGRPGVAVGVGAAAVGAAAIGAAAANPYNNLYNYYNGDYYNAIGAQCGYAPYPPCY